MVLPPLAPASHGARFGDRSVPVLPGSAHRGSLHGRRWAGRETGGAASSCPPLPVPVPRPPSRLTPIPVPSAPGACSRSPEMGQGGRLVVDGC